MVDSILATKQSKAMRTLLKFDILFCPLVVGQLAARPLVVLIRLEPSYVAAGLNGADDSKVRSKDESVHHKASSLLLLQAKL